LTAFIVLPQQPENTRQMPLAVVSDNRATEPTAATVSPPLKADQTFVDHFQKNLIFSLIRDTKSGNYGSASSECYQSAFLLGNSRTTESSMSSILKGLLAVAVLVGTVSACQASFINPGFETGDFTGWSVSSNSSNFGVAISGTPIAGTYPGFGPTFVQTRSGNFAAYAVVDTSGPNHGMTLSQNVVLAPGNYDVGFYGGANSPGQFAYGSFPTAILVNGSPISSNTLVGYPGNSSYPSFPFQRFDGTFTTAGGSVNLAFDLTGSGSGQAGISFDDFFVNPLQPVPEPASLTLLASSFLAFGGFDLYRRRRGTTGSSPAC
jgi:hypothetical protein